MSRGFTIIELMIAAAVLAILSVVMASFAAQARREHRTTTGYQQDLAGWRRALDLLAADLRAAGDVVVRDDGLTATERYRVVDGELLRGDRRVAGAVQQLRAWREGELVHVVLVGAPRAPGAAPVELTLSVAPRNGATP